MGIGCLEAYKAGQSKAGDDMRQTLLTGTVIDSWHYDQKNMKGQGIGVEDGNGHTDVIVNVESVKCLEGIVNRVVINKAKLKDLGWIIIESEAEG